MDAEMKKHNERVMQAMEVQAELMLSLQQAVADSTEKIVKSTEQSTKALLSALVILTPVLTQSLMNMKFQSWCASEVTKIQNAGATLEVQRAYDQMLVDSAQTSPPEKDPKHGETVVMENSVEISPDDFDGVKALGDKGPKDPFDGARVLGDEDPSVKQFKALQKLGIIDEEETVPKDLKALLDAQPKEE